MNWLFYTIIAILFSVIYALISKRILSHKDNYDPIIYTSVLFFGVACYAFITYLVRGFRFSDITYLFSADMIPVLTANVILYSVAPSLYFRALKHLPVSEVTILYTLTGIYTLIIGVFLGTELFLWMRIIGAIFILSAITLLSYKDGKWKVNRYMLMLVIATFIYALAITTDKVIISKNSFSLPFFLAVNFGIPAFLIPLINAKRISDFVTMYKKGRIILIFFNAFFCFITFFSVFNAYNVGGDASQVNLVFSTEVIVMVVFAAIFLKERKDMVLKIISALCATVGVYLLS